MSKTTVSFRCTETLLDDLDGIAEENYMDRTGVIIQALLSYLRASEEVPPSEPQKNEEK